MNRLYYAYARHALVTALRVARVRPGDVVLLPNFICRDVLASLAAVQASAVYYDIGDDLQISPTGSLPSAKVFLAVNYFGFPANLERIRDRLSDSSTVLIEDNAHGWLSSDDAGVALGSRTALGITSFRKTIRSLDGAFLEWQDGAIHDASTLHEPLPFRDEPLALSYRLRRNISLLDHTSGFNLLPTARKYVRFVRRLSGRPPIDPHVEDEFKLPQHRALHQSSFTMMNAIKIEEERHRRRSSFQACQLLADEYGVRTPHLAMTDGVCPMGFPYFPNSSRDEAFRRAIRRQRLGEIITWPSLPATSTLSSTSILRELHLVNFLQ